MRGRRVRALGVVAALLGAGLVAPSSAAALTPAERAVLASAELPDPDGVSLGEAPARPVLGGVQVRSPLVSPPAEAVSLPWADLSTREGAKAFFDAHYRASAEPAIAWTGAIATCAPGTTATGFRLDVLRRVAFYRAMAGVPAAVDLSGVYSGAAQSGALMMSRNGALSHSPPSSWACYTASGAEAAGHSNLALGANGRTAIDLYVMDPGTANAPVGHRRWILYPQTRHFGTGDVPATTHPASNDLWVFDENLWSPRPATREGYVAWPPPGYVPDEVVYPRWSLSVAGADFTSAQVELREDGAVIPVTVEHRNGAYGESTIVWRPVGMGDWGSWPALDGDTTYQVTVSGIAGAPSTISYRVTVFDPDGTGDVEPFVDVPAWHGFHDEIGWMSATGISTGYDIGGGRRAFRPSQPVLREQMAAFLFRMAGDPAYQGPRTSPFVDVPTTHVFYDAISWMAARGISTGYDLGGGRRAFRPTDPVLREQAAAFLHRLVGSPAVGAGSPAFRDVAHDHVFGSSIAWLAANGVIRGYDVAVGVREFRPRDQVLREQVAAFLHRLNGTGPLGS